MSEYILRAVAHANGTPCPVSGQYLSGFDDSKFDGIGLARWTRERDVAKRFATHAAAFAFWQQQSDARPLRSDGRPNRPLTAYTVEILEIKA